MTTSLTGQDLHDGVCYSVIPPRVSVMLDCTHLHMRGLIMFLADMVRARVRNPAQCTARAYSPRAGHNRLQKPTDLSE